MIVDVHHCFLRITNSKRIYLQNQFYVLSLFNIEF